MLSCSPIAEKVPARSVHLFGWFAVPYLLTHLSLAVAGIHVSPPWIFLGALTIIALPYAYCVARVLALPGALSGRHAPLGPPVSMALGTFAVWLFSSLRERPLVLLAVFLCVLVIDARRFSPTSLRSLAASVAVIVVGYGTVWNLNYLFAPASSAALHDPTILRLDLAIYRWMLARPMELEQFPLFESRFFFTLLENAYQMLFVELFVVVLVLLRKGGDLGPFLRSIFLCYFLGLVTFFFYPVVGPCIFQPGSLHPAYHATRTYQLMQAMAAEFAALGKETTHNGLAYFVAVPSLHVAMAVLFQCFLRASPCHFWAFLPVNVLMAISTVLLGYHYLIDLPAGVLVALAALWVVRGTSGADTAVGPRSSAGGQGVRAGR